MIKIGLTGSIGMGKSYIASIFQQYNIPVFNADLVVDNILKDQKRLETILKKLKLDQSLTKSQLSKIAFNSFDVLNQLEKTLHPLVFEKQKEFMLHQCLRGHKIILCEIPLLFEANWEGYYDYVIVAVASKEIQKKRVLKRPGMTHDLYKKIMRRQKNSFFKIAKSDYTIHTGWSKSYSKRQTLEVIKKILRDYNERNCIRY